MLISKKLCFTRLRWIEFNRKGGGSPQGHSVMERFQQSRPQPTTVVTLVLVTFLATAGYAEIRKEFRFTVSRNTSVTVDTQYGAISVKPGSANQVVVTATLQSDKVEVDQQQNGNRIEIASHLLQGGDEQSGRVDYELQIPADATLDLRSMTGPLSAERLQGDLTLEGSDAVVNVHSIDNGHIRVRTMRGPITLVDVHNSRVELASISGDVHLRSVTGPMVQANSGSGKIVYEGDFGSGGDYKFTTHTGDIEAQAPANVSADFRAHSVLGEVQNDFPLQQQHSRFSMEAGRSFFGTVGKAASEVVLRSFSGKIRLKRR
jgi:DUF4097 and DUF4098 domain-containing protein YvlB